jgi:hypothetical protein
MKQLMNQMSEWWCERMHDGVMWPSHGKYRCRTCMREYAVEFEKSPRSGLSETPAPLAAWVATRRA